MGVLAGMSFRNKLIWSIMVTSTIVLLLSASAFMTIELVSFGRSRVGELSTLAEKIGHKIAASVESNDKTAAEKSLSFLETHPYITAASIFTKDGTLLARHQRSDMKTELLSSIPVEEEYYFNYRSLNLFKPVILDNRFICNVYLQSDLKDFYLRLKKYAGIASIIVMLCLPIVYVVSSRLQRIVSRPILALAETVKSVSSSTSLRYSS